MPFRMIKMLGDGVGCANHPNVNMDMTFWHLLSETHM
jgi:hypothetical protein